jgi:hypothetical protein
MQKSEKHTPTEPSPEGEGEEEEEVDLKVKPHEYRVMSIVIRFDKYKDIDLTGAMLKRTRALFRFVASKFPIFPEGLELTFLLCFIHVHKFDSDESIHMKYWHEIVEVDVLEPLEIHFCKFLWTMPDYEMLRIIDKPAENVVLSK